MIIVKGDAPCSWLHLPSGPALLTERSSQGEKRNWGGFKFFCLFFGWRMMWRRWRFWWQLFNYELLLRVDKGNDVDEIRDEDEDEDNIEKGGAVGDCLTVCCCPGCAHLQQYKEVIIISLMFTLLHNHHHHHNSIVTTKDFLCLKVNPQKSLVCGESTIQ